MAAAGTQRIEPVNGRQPADSKKGLTKIYRRVFVMQNETIIKLIGHRPVYRVDRHQATASSDKRTDDGLTRGRCGVPAMTERDDPHELAPASNRSQPYHAFS
jgi:hypothetical protein